MLSFIVKNTLIPCNIKEKNPRKRTVTDKNTDHQFIISSQLPIYNFLQITIPLGNYPFF